MPELDSELTGAGDFPSTAWTRLVRGHDRQAALEYLAAGYWKPVYLYIRRRWKRGHEDAKDLTQAFFAQAIQTELLGKADPARGSFRKFLRKSVENFLRNEYRDSRTLKRGGGERLVPLEASGADESLVSREGDPAELFDRDWLESVFRQCVPRLKEQYASEGRPEYFEVFRRYDLERGSDAGPSYQDLARDLSLSVDDVRNRLTHARGRWKKIVIDELRESVASPEDLQEELRELFP